MTDADERRVLKALQGIQFPAAKAQLVAYAEDRGAESKTLRALEALPEGDYSSGEEVEQAVPQRPDEELS
ncbi:hypothetical protein FHX42_003369 [Saccharopolyspora lacisalsi]|uniref:DUF2795 domain-containing protein n=1 Tax=Halosaccharopolyspora lacisalsi TaxID=1000566 RepID=A0A839DY92_9PSEU|nr:DUF2795 domain-containing protein [Halosaccharopolyspora lacisalsi]MBA8826003.1 hypothetical protein [Halosaccharopolyspora lacisalsi]